MFNVNDMIENGPEQAVNYLRDDADDHFSQVVVSQETGKYAGALVLLLNQTDIWRVAETNVFLLTLT